MKTQKQPQRRRSVWWAFLALFCLASAVRGATDAKEGITGKDEMLTVDLPPLIVLENKPGARWLYVAFPGVEILSVCSEETTLRFAEIYRAQRELMRLVVPDEFLPTFSVPELVILFDQRNGRAMPAELKEKANSLEPVEISRPTDFSLNALSERALRIRVLPNLMVSSLDSIASCADLSTIAVSYNWTGWERAFRLGEGYLRTVLSRRRPALPEWYVNGAVELLRTAEAKGDGLLLWQADWAFRDEKGRPITGRRRGKDDPRAHVITPLPVLFQKPAEGSTAYSGFDDATLRANQALFIRWAIDGKAPARRAELAELVKRSMRELVTEEMLKTCFGLSADQIRRQLEGYLPLATRRQTLLRKPGLGATNLLRAREATPLEIGRIMGDWQRLEATQLAELPKYRVRYLDAASKAVAKLQKTGESDARLLAVSGLIELERGNTSEARMWLECAFSQDRGASLRPAAGLALAQLRLSEALAQSAHLELTGVRLSAETVENVLEPVLAVVGKPPASAEMYAFVQAVLSRCDAAPPKEVRAVLAQGHFLFDAPPMASQIR